MKKNKMSVKKLKLNKSVISKLEEGQVTGGTIVSIACPTLFNCPTMFRCPTLFNCPTLNIVECQTTTLQTIGSPGCGGGSLIDGCKTALGCF